MANETAFKPDVFFISYDGIIKNYRPWLLKSISEDTTIKDRYSDILNFQMIDGMSIEQLNGLILRSQSKNIFKYIGYDDTYDYDTLMNELYGKYLELYIYSELLPIGFNISNLFMKKIRGSIIVYSEIDDPRIYFDMVTNVIEPNQNTDIKYFIGDPIDIIKSIDKKITTFMINDIDVVNRIIDEKLCVNSLIMVPKYGYNYKPLNDTMILKIDNLLSKTEKLHFEIVDFVPFTNYELQ
jgi:hypothetical protein